MCFSTSAPSAADNFSLKNKKLLSVSSVRPDLLTTSSAARRGSSCAQIASLLRASALSATKSCGCPLFPEKGYSGSQKAFISICMPRAEPPMPISTICPNCASSRPISFSAEISRSGRFIQP